MERLEEQELEKFFINHPTKEKLIEFNNILNSILEAPNTTAEENKTVREIQERIEGVLDLLIKG